MVPPISEEVDFEAELLRLVNDAAASRKVGHQHTLAVADEVRIDVLVGLAVLLHSGHVQAALVRERALADVRLALVRLDVGELVHHAGQRRKLAEL